MTAERSDTQPAGAGLTYADYVDFPDDGQRYELIDGGVWVTPAPHPDHQAVSLQLAVSLHRWTTDHPPARIYYAPIDVILADDTVLQPDLLVVLDPRAITRRGIEQAPSLAIEILSPSTRARDRGLKRERYARSGVAEYWIVDPDNRRVVRHELKNGRLEVVEQCAEGMRLISTALKGFEIPIATVFATI